MNNILDLNTVKGMYTFYFNEGKTERYFCRCGHDFEIEAQKEDDEVEDMDMDDELFEVFGKVKISLKSSIKCPSCGTDYKIPENQSKLKSEDQYFITGYGIEDNEKEYTLYSAKAKPELIKGVVNFAEIYKSITYNKDNGDLYITDYAGVKTDVDLDNLVEAIDQFFKKETDAVSNIFELHQYLIGISKYVSDSENIDIVEGLLSELRKSKSDDNNATVKKILTIFYSIIKYSNLSTIAMTKSPIFLYELIKECNPPKASVLVEEKVTSPIKIFNFLARNYVKNINDDITEERKQKTSFVFKSNKEMVELENAKTSQKKDSEESLVRQEADYTEALEDTMKVTEGKERKMTINVKKVDDYKGGKVTQNSKGQYEALKIEGDGQISKFIYKKLKNFHDYEQLVKYMKHLDYKNLVELLTKFEYDLVVNMVDLIYHRNNVDMDEVKRLTYLFEDHVKNRTIDVQKATKVYDEDKELSLDYAHLGSFEFGFYDDSKKMIKALEFDPRKDFYKLKTNAQLKEYHDQIVKYYVAIAYEEDEGYKMYFDRFKFLEKKGPGIYEGPLRVELIDTPTGVVREGRDMHHSVGSYVEQVMEGQYIIFRVFDDSDDLEEGEHDRYTLGLKFVESTGLQFAEVKTYGNILGTTRFKTLMQKWLESMEIRFTGKESDIVIRKMR